MRPIDNETRITMNSRRNFVNYATMTLSNGTVLNLKPSDFRIAGNNFTDDLVDGDAFQIGTAIGKTATIILDNTDGRIEQIGSTEVVYPHGKFSEYDFYMAHFSLNVCLPEAYHISGELKDQMIPIGDFTVVTPTSHGSTIEIVGVDNMYLFDRSFDECDLDFSTNPTLKTILNKCCADCGVAIGYTNFDNENLTINTRPEDTTYRQVVSYIATMAGCNAKINITGALILTTYDMSALSDGLDGGTFSTLTTPYSDGDVADGGDFNPWNLGYVADGGNFTTPLGFHNLTAINGTSVSTDDIKITGVLVSYEDTSVHYPNSTGWDYYAIEITENPFVAGYESTVAQTIYNKLSGLKFRPFTTSSIQDPTIEAGDCCVVYDVKGNMYNSIITNVVFNTGGMTEVSCHAEPPAKQGARYSAPTSVMRVANSMTSYQSHTAHFNEIASEALGYFKTEEVDAQTGATITYLHDQPTLASSTNIVKIAGGIVAISDNGGTTYNQGFDASTGTMLLNLIYVHGLTSDWINTGFLTVGGVNNENGIIHVVNEIKQAGPYSTDFPSHAGQVWWWAANLGYTWIKPAGTYKLTKVVIDNVSDPTQFNNFIWRVQASTDHGSTYKTVKQGNLVIGDNIVNYVMTITSTDDTVYRLQIAKDGDGKALATDPTFDYSIYATSVNTIIDKDGVEIRRGNIKLGAYNSSSGHYPFEVDDEGNLHAENGEIAGLTTKWLEKGWEFDGKLSVYYNGAWHDNVDHYFKISAYDGLNIGRAMDPSNADVTSACWSNMWWLQGYSMLRVDYGSNQDSYRGIFVTNIGNNDYTAIGSTYAYLRVDGIHVVSDRRSKTDITDLSKTISKNLVLKSRPVKFKFKNDNEYHYGFIAQEIEEVVPDNNSVIEHNDDNDMYSMNYQEMIAPMVKVIQTQQEEIDDLKARIKALEDIVNTKLK